MSQQRDLFSGEFIPRRQGGNGKLRRSNGHSGNSCPNCRGGQDTKVLVERIASLEQTIADLRDSILSQQLTKESYSTHEVASILGRKPYTVREWCRLQRINAYKAMCGRGCEEEWRVSHEELCRIQNEGLLPAKREIDIRRQAAG